MSNCNCNQGRLPCTCKTASNALDDAIEIIRAMPAPAKAPGRTRHPLANIAEWRKGCSCGAKESPVQCEACTEGLILAVENWFTQRNAHRGAVADNILENLDDRAGAKGKGIAGDAATLIRELDAELYAAQDQVTGPQELMAAQRAPGPLDTAVRHLVAAAEADDSHQGSPEHGHSAPGLWDGDRQHPRGSLCEECAAWNVLRKYASTDIEAAEGVMEQARDNEVYALPVDLLIDADTSGMPNSISVYRSGVAELGIQWAGVRFMEGGKGLILLGCKDVPVTLPKWLKVVKP